MGLAAAAEDWFGQLCERLDVWVRERAGADRDVQLGALAVLDGEAGTRDLAASLWASWTNPEQLWHLDVVRSAVAAFGRVLDAAFRGLAPGEAPATWTGLVLDRGVAAAAAAATLPELVDELRETLPGLERGLPWRRRPYAGPAALIAQVSDGIGARSAGDDHGLLLDLVRVPPEERLARLTEVAAEALDVEPALRDAATAWMGDALTRLLEGARGAANGADPAGRGELLGRQAWLELEWQAWLARESGGVLLPRNWRVTMAARAQREADRGYHFALGRDPETVAAAATWQLQADEDLEDALRFADPEHEEPADEAPAASSPPASPPDDPPRSAPWPAGWLRWSTRRARPPHRSRPTGRLR